MYCMVLCICTYRYPPLSLPVLQLVCRHPLHCHPVLPSDTLTTCSDLSAAMLTACNSVLSAPWLLSVLQFFDRHAYPISPILPATAVLTACYPVLSIVMLSNVIMCWMFPSLLPVLQLFLSSCIKVLRIRLFTMIMIRIQIWLFDTDPDLDPYCFFLYILSRFSLSVGPPGPKQQAVPNSRHMLTNFPFQLILLCFLE